MVQWRNPTRASFLTGFAGVALRRAESAKVSLARFHFSQLPARTFSSQARITPSCACPGSSVEASIKRPTLCFGRRFSRSAIYSCCPAPALAAAIPLLASALCPALSVERISPIGYTSCFIHQSSTRVRLSSGCFGYALRSQPLYK
jgi:hypothetical protein